MISAEDVCPIFLTFISPGDYEAADRALPLCSSSLERIMKKLRDDADSDDSRIKFASACDAYYSYALSKLSDIEENADFKAGDVTVKRRTKEALEIAGKIRENGLDSIKELLKDDSFGAWSV